MLIPARNENLPKNMGENLVWKYLLYLNKNTCQEFFGDKL